MSTDSIINNRNELKLAIQIYVNLMHSNKRLISAVKMAVQRSSSPNTQQSIRERIKFSRGGASDYMFQNDNFLSMFHNSIKKSITTN